MILTFGLNLLFGAPSVTLDEIAPLNVILERLTPAQEPVKLRSLVGNPVIWVKVDNRPLSEVRASIAQALSAEWEGNKLTRKKELRDRIAAHDDEIRAKKIAAGIAALKVSEEDPSTRAQNMARELTDFMAQPATPSYPVGPSDDLLRKLLKTMSPMQLAQQKPYQDVLYSNRPSIAETQLPRTAETVITRYARIEQELSKRIGESARGEWGQYEFSRIIQGILTPQPVGRVLLSTSWSDQTFYAVLSTFSADGSLRSWANLSFPLNPTPRAKVEPGQERGNILKSSLPPWKDLLNPVANDPLNAVVGPYLRAAQGQFKPNQVMVLPDNLVPEFAGNPPLRDLDVLSELKDEGVELSTEGEWTLGRYSEPSAIDRINISRESLRRWSMTVSAQDPVRPTAVLFYEGGLSISTSNLDNWYEDVVLPKARDLHLPPRTLPKYLLRFLGSLSESRWQALNQGTPITLGDRGASQHLFEWTNSSFRALTFLQPAPADIYRIGSMAFPSGIPLSGVLTRSSTPELYVRGERIANEWIPLDSLAQIMAWEHPRSTAEAIVQSAEGVYELGLYPGQRFTLFPTESCSISADQRYGEVTSAKVSGRLSTWPAEQRALLISAIDSVLRSYQIGNKALPPP